MTLLWDVFVVAGFCLVVYGAWEFSPPLAWVIAGVGLVVLGIGGYRRTEGKADDLQPPQ